MVIYTYQIIREYGFTGLALGLPFDMRGKKFLDSLVYTSRPNQTTPIKGVNNSGSNTGSLSAEESSTLLASSIFGFGFLGGNTPTDAASPPLPGSGRSAGSDANRRIAKGRGGKIGEILFVQSPALFLLVETREEGTYSVMTRPELFLLKALSCRILCLAGGAYPSDGCVREPEQEKIDRICAFMGAS
jgi:hypothetical protein